MTDTEHSPEFDPSVHEKMSLYALILNVHEMVGMARRLDQNLRGEMHGDGRPSPAHRFLMTEVPLPSRPPQRQILPVRAERAVLRPKDSAEHNINLLIVRVPLDGGGHGVPKDAFIELVDNYQGRWQYLLNSEGLWPYANVTDLATTDGRHFRLKNPVRSEGSAVMEQMSRHIGSARLEAQTSFDIDPE